jgi:hypothetical protein
VCTSDICRTPGFWGTHGGTERDGSVNITQAVINAGGGCFEICGEIITNTALDSANSALEAMCVRVQGDSTLQLARQLTATALNCIMTNGNADCTGTGAEALFQSCNAVCPGGDANQIGVCINALDCYNNGGTFDPATGSCKVGDCLDDATGNDVGDCGTDQTCPLGSTCTPTPGNCHSAELCNTDLNLCFDEGLKAGSSKACNAANGNTCQILQPNENLCASGLRQAAPESCI